PQTGNVIIEDFVDIGAATTIDRATLGSTIIRRGVKLDNQIQIAHNVEIGKNTVIAAQTGIAGSTKIGENCQIGGQVGFAGHITIGNNVKIQAQSGIGRSIKDNETLQGSPAFSYGDWNKSYVYFKNLPKIVKNITDLEKKENGKNKKRNNVKNQTKSGIRKSIKDNETLQGSPGFSYGDWNKSYVYFKNLPKIVKNITDLKKKVNGNN